MLEEVPVVWINNFLFCQRDFIKCLLGVFLIRNPTTLQASLWLVLFDTTSTEVEINEPFRDEWALSRRGNRAKRLIFQGCNVTGLKVWWKKTSSRESPHDWVSVHSENPQIWLHLFIKASFTGKYWLKVTEKYKNFLLKCFGRVGKNLVEIKEQTDEKRQPSHRMTHAEEGLDGENGMFVWQ